jgi:hypothetical protein
MMANTSFTKFGSSRLHLEGAYKDRFEEANELLNSHRYGMAIAMALYGLEIYLKVRICERLDLEDLPTAFQTHDLAGLLVCSGIKKRMDGLGISPTKQNWDELCNQQVDKYRYQPNSITSASDARTTLYRILDPNDGVFPWLKAQS